MKKDPQELIARIRKDPYLSREEKSQLIESLRKTKRYGLVWEEKREEVEERQRDRIPVLTEVKERAIVSDAADAPNHILIEGDNLDALVALTYTHEGKIDVIYIDPPYNTGNKDFIYNDCFIDKESPYRHSLWLSFMSRRLKIAKRLLSDKGVIFISIDDNEQAQLKLLCDEIFGDSNHISTLIWKSKSGGANDSKYIASDSEYIFVYCKSETHFELGKDKGGSVTTQYNRQDEKGDYSLDRLDKQSIRYSSSCDYEIVGPDGTIYRPQHKDPARPNASWRWGKDTVEERYDELVFENGHVYTKNYRKDEIIPRNLLIDERFGRTRTGKTDLFSIIGANGFNNPKPPKLIYYLVGLFPDKNATILDFFAGSGTTLHATMALNAEDGGHRQCILVTNNENRICEEVTYVRNKKVIEGYVNAKGETVKGLTANSLRYYRADFIDREKTAQNRRSLAAASADLICIREGSYNELKTFGKLKLKSSVARHFEGGGRHILLILNENAIEYFVKEIKDADSPDKFKVYVFSPGDYAYDDEFMDVADRVELCAVPSSIYNAYEKVLPKRVCDAGDEESGDGDIAEFDGGSGDELPGNVGNAMGAVRKSRSGMKMMWRNSLC